MPKALGDFLVLDAVYATGGTRHRGRPTRTCSPTLGAGRRGWRACSSARRAPPASRRSGRLRESGWIGGDDEVVLLNTGAGIKYPETVVADPPVLARGASIPH